MTGCIRPSSKRLGHSDLTPRREGTTTDCDALLDGNAGCGVRVAKPSSYGPAFNVNGGGFYATERTSEFIRVRPPGDSALACADERG